MSEALSYVPTDTAQEAHEVETAEVIPLVAVPHWLSLPSAFAFVSPEAPKRSSRPLIAVLIVVALLAVGTKVAPKFLSKKKPATRRQAARLRYFVEKGDGRAFELTTSTTASFIDHRGATDQTDRTVLKGTWKILSDDDKTALVGFTPSSYAYQVNDGVTVTLRHPQLSLTGTLWKNQLPPADAELKETGDWTMGDKLLTRPLVEDAFLPYGLKAVLPGESWDVPQPLKEPIFGHQLAPTVRFTLSAERPTRDRRQITGTLNMPFGFVLTPAETAKMFGWADDPPLARMVQAQVSGNLDYHSTYSVDPRSGVVLEATGTYGIVIRVELDRIDLPAVTAIVGTDFHYKAPTDLKKHQTA